MTCICHGDLHYFLWTQPLSSATQSVPPQLSWCCRERVVTMQRMQMSQTGSDGDLIWWRPTLSRQNCPSPHWFISLSPFVVQEPEPDDSGPGEVSSWDVNTERPTSTVGKLSKTESQNHMSPRYSADLHIWKHADKIVSLCFYKSYFTFSSVSLRHLGLTQKCFWKSKRLGFFSSP